MQLGRAGSETFQVFPFGFLPWIILLSLSHVKRCCFSFCQIIKVYILYKMFLGLAEFACTDLSPSPGWEALHTAVLGAQGGQQDKDATAASLPPSPDLPALGRED